MQKSRLPTNRNPTAIYSWPGSPLRPAAALNWSFGRIPMALARRQPLQPTGFGPVAVIPGDTAGSLLQSAAASIEDPVLAAQAAISEAALNAEKASKAPLLPLRRLSRYRRCRPRTLKQPWRLRRNCKRRYARATSSKRGLPPPGSARMMMCARRLRVPNSHSSPSRQRSPLPAPNSRIRTPLWRCKSNFSSRKCSSPS